MYNNVFNHRCILGHLGCFQFWGVKTKAAMNFHLYFFFFFCINVREIPESATVKLFDKCIFSFRRNCQYAFAR